MRARLFIASLAATLAAATSVLAATPATTRVSSSSTGVQVNSNAEFPVVSQNGRWTAFQSTASNLVSPDTLGFADIFLRDNKTGQTIRIAPPGVEPNGPSRYPVISGDGRWVAFESSARNLVPGLTGGFTNVYLYDRTTGAIRRVSGRADGDGGGGTSQHPDISSDGAAVVFTSNANNLVAGDAGLADVFLYRIATGALTRVSAPVAGGEPNGPASVLDWASVSNGAQFVAFTSAATNLVVGDTSAALRDVFVRDTQANTIARANVTSAGGEANASAANPVLSANGCHVAFTSNASNLVATDDGVSRFKAFLRDRCAGTTEIASLANGTPAPQGSVLTEYPLAISDDGCLVGMVSAEVIAAGGWRGVAVRDRCLGVTSRIDVSTGGEGGVGHTNGPSFSAGSARYVAFHSGATNLVVAADANLAVSDAFIRDRANAAPPVADLKLTVNNRQVVADASASRDLDADVASITISFGDGTAAVAGANALHDYTQTGTFTVTATVTDTDGLTATATAVAVVTDLAPPNPGRTPPGAGGLAFVLSRASLTARAFAVVPRGRRPGKGLGTSLRVTANQAGTLTVRVEQAKRARRSGGRCRVKATAGPRCSVFTQVSGKIVAKVTTGANTVPLTGRVGGSPLPPGAYRLTLTGLAPGVTASKPLRLTFTIRSP